MEQGTLPGVVLALHHCLVLLRYIFLLMSPVLSIECICSEMVTLVFHYSLRDWLPSQNWWMLLATRLYASPAVL